MQEDPIKNDFTYYFPGAFGGKIVDTSKDTLTLPEESVDAIIANDNDEIAHLYTILKKRGVICVRTSRYRSTARLLEKLGFTSHDVYLVYPSYEVPRFIIPQNDRSALRFSMNAISVGARFGSILRFFGSISFFLPMYFLCQRVIFSKK